MIVTEAGSIRTFGAGLCGGKGADAARITPRWPRRIRQPPATAGIVFDGDEGRLSEEAFVRDFRRPAGGEAKVLCAVQEPFHKRLLTGKTTARGLAIQASYYAVSPRTADQSGPSMRFMRSRMEQDHRGEGQPSLIDLASRGESRADPRSPGQQNLTRRCMCMLLDWCPSARGTLQGLRPANNIS